MSEKNTVIGFDGLIEFGDYLNRLHDTDYTFEMEDEDGRMADGKRHRWCLLTEDHQRGRRCRSRRTTTSMMPWLVQWFGGLWPRLRG